MGASLRSALPEVGRRHCKRLLAADLDTIGYPKSDVPEL